MTTEAGLRSIALGEALERFAGKIVVISEEISCRVGTGFERHSTTRSALSFEVRRVGWLMSGGHFVINGADGVSEYQIGTKCLIDVLVADNRVSCVERYGEEAERRSTLSLSH